ncbi:alpha/beta fold hydrolase [Patescibacteria group bacterium]|nr:alpha/beta fold hydrolase [Patescibacteria group bacterium]MBU1889912.1 alpha/beta fold hydrolase [Patescibacteria group bacterium]
MDGSSSVDQRFLRTFSLKGNNTDTGVLLLHGFSGSPYDLKDLAEYFSDAGLSVLGYRLPGHATNVEELNRMKSQDWLNGVIKAYNYFAGLVKNIYVVGFSFGGNLALHAIALGKIYPRGIATVSTPIFFPKEYMHRWIIPIISPFKKSVNKYWVKPEERDYYKQRGKYITIPLNASREMYKFVRKNRSSIGQVKCPIVIIQSTQDKVVKPTSAQFIYDKVGSSDKELIWTDDIKHNLSLSIKRNDIYKKIMNFIK